MAAVDGDLVRLSDYRGFGASIGGTPAKRLEEYVANQSAALRFASYTRFLRRMNMPDDKTLATMLAICDLIKRNASGVENAVAAYQQAMKDVLEYRRSKGLTELGGLPSE